MSNHAEQHGDDARLRRILESRPCGLLTDIDGTISPIAPTPDAARVSTAAREQLQLLARRLDLVAAISGRAAPDAAALVGIGDMVYIGNHGMELWRDGASEPVPDARPFVPAIGTVMKEAQARITLEGVLFENKGVTGSIHYRQSPDPETARVQLEEVLQELVARHGLRLTGGRLIWEVRPPLSTNKGTAVRMLVEQYGLRGAFFLGDDRTDADAFAALRELREQGVCETLNIGVTADETPEVVRELADVLVEGVTGVEQVLARLAELADERGQT